MALNIAILSIDSRSVVVVVVIVGGAKQRFSIQWVGSVYVEGYAGSFHDGVDEPELDDIHKDGEYAHRADVPVSRR
jgi:hypothetical protein